MIRPPRCKDLTVPLEGSSTVRQLLSVYLAHQRDSYLALKLAEAPAESRALRAQQQFCSELLRSNAGPFYSVINRPTTGGLIRCLADGSVAGIEVVSSARLLLGTLQAELALCGEFAPPLVLSPSPRRFILLGVRSMLCLPDDVMATRFDERGIHVVSSKGVRVLPWDEIGDGATEYSRPSDADITDRVTLALADDCPLAGNETHPDKHGNALDLGGRDVDEWTNGMREALDIIRTGLPEIADEIELLAERLVPVGFDLKSHLSASFQEVIGTIYLSLHPNAMTLAEALIHEHSHNKFNMLWSLAPILTNAFSPLFPSPYRPDLRPLHGVLLGVHAFLPVEKLYENLAEMGHRVSSDLRFSERRQQIRDRNFAGCETLQRYGEVSEAGESVMAEIYEWNRYFS